MLLNIKRKNKKVEPVRTAPRLNLALIEFAPRWEAVGENLTRLSSVVERIFSAGEGYRTSGRPASVGEGHPCSVGEGYPASVGEGHRTSAGEGGPVPDASAPNVPDVLVLPEFFSTGFTMNPNAAEHFDSSPTLSWMERTAGLYDCAVAGSVPIIMPDGRRYNRFFFVTPDGIAGQYDKRHLFFGGEDENYTAGSAPTTIHYRGWRIMLGICFDMRFPVWSRNDPGNPYDLYINIANWPTARKKVARTLIEARAIENVCYVAYCNRTGQDPMLTYAGESAVINHRGREKSERMDFDGTSVVFASLDMPELLRFRASFPVLDSADRFEITRQTGSRTEITRPTADRINRPNDGK